jgi:CheY-like chemotaxis protein
MAQHVDIRKRRSPLKGPSEKYLIRLTIAPKEREVLWKLRQDIENLGGVETENGFAFFSEWRRNDAAEVLIDTWGPGYFESITAQDESQARLLIAESDVKLCAKLGEFFRRRGFSVETVRDALHGLEMLRIHRPHVLIINSQLLWGGGDGLLARIRETPRFDDLKVLVICEGSERLLPDFSDSPIAACFRKPFRCEEILTALQSATKELPLPHNV